MCGRGRTHKKDVDSLMQVVASGAEVRLDTSRGPLLSEDKIISSLLGGHHLLSAL